MSLLYTQSWAAGPSTFCNAGHIDLFGTDPLYPEIRSAESVQVFAGLGPNGENVVDVHPGAPAVPYSIAGVWVANQSWALPSFDITVKWKPTANALNESGNYAILFHLLHLLYTDVFWLAYDTASEAFELRVDNQYYQGPSVSAASIQDSWQTFRFCGRVSTDNGDGPADGTLKVYRNGTLMPGLDLTGLYLVMGPGTSPVATGYRAGYFGMIGQLGAISISNDPCGVEIPTGEPSICPPCVTPDQGTVGSGGRQGAGATPWIQPSIGQQLACAGGGLVPTQADLLHSELWWGR